MFFNFILSHLNKTKNFFLLCLEITLSEFKQKLGDICLKNYIMNFNSQIFGHDFM